MKRNDLPQMIKDLKTKKQEALLKAADPELCDADHEALLALGEAAGKAALLMEECYIRSTRLISKGLLTEDSDVPLDNKGIVGGEPIAHPPVPSLSDPLPIGTWGPTKKMFDYNKWKAELVHSLGSGRVSAIDLESPNNSICRTCGLQDTVQVWEGDSIYDCPECGSNNVVNYFYVVANDL